MPSLSLQAKPQTLGVYFPSIKSATALSSSLQGDPLLSSTEIFVFSKFKDFEIALKSRSFDYIITNSYYFGYSKNDYNIQFQFLVDGKETFELKLISLSAKKGKKDIKSATIAAVQTLGRRDMKKFIEEIFKIATVKRVKNIAKAQDIFPILAMNNAEFAIASPEMLTQMAKDYPAKPIEVLSSIPLKHLIVARKITANNRSINFSNLNEKSLADLGVTAVKSL